MNSMTGFGRAEGSIGNGHYSVELKSVNHRYQDLRFRLSNSISVFEPRLAEILKKRFVRGAFEISIKPKVGSNDSTSSGFEFQVDEKAAKSFQLGCEKIGALWGKPVTPTLEGLLSTGKGLIPIEETLDSGESVEQLEAVFLKAVDDLEKSRGEEGARLKTLLNQGCQELLTLTEAMEKHAKDQPEKIREKLTSRIENWSLGAKADASRLEWEIAYFAERSDVTEEIDRLKSHANSFSEMLSAKGPVGRKLDFMTQEMHREVNTMGSKSSLIPLTQATVEGKTLIEKLREQVQNVE